MPMRYQEVFLSAVILTVGIIVALHDANTGSRNILVFSGNQNRAYALKENIVLKSSRKAATESHIQNVSEKIQPESVPWLVKISTGTGFHLFTGALVTWQKYVETNISSNIQESNHRVITTCNAATSTQIKYVTADFGGVEPQQRNVMSTAADGRCKPKENMDMMERYNVGIIVVDEPFVANRTLNVIQFPTLNKRRYLELTNQVTARGSKCHFYLWNDEGVLNLRTITPVQSHNVLKCQGYQGVHEFMCSTTPVIVTGDSDTMEGTPIMCGEDVYGVMPDKYEQPGLDTMNDMRVYIWLRLDEFIHLFVESDPGLVDFIKNVQY